MPRASRISRGGVHSPLSFCICRSTARSLAVCTPAPDNPGRSIVRRVLTANSPNVHQSTGLDERAYQSLHFRQITRFAAKDVHLDAGAPDIGHGQAPQFEPNFMTVPVIHPPFLRSSTGVAASRGFTPAQAGCARVDRSPHLPPIADARLNSVTQGRS
jgi:hypothetical protein